MQFFSTDFCWAVNQTHLFARINRQTKLCNADTVTELDIKADEEKLKIINQCKNVKGYESMMLLVLLITNLL